MTTYLLITSDKPTELTASTDRKNWLPVVNAQEVGLFQFGEWKEWGFMSGKELKLDTPVELEGWEVEVVMSDGWQPTYNNPDNSGLEQPSEPIAYRLKRSEPVKAEKIYREPTCPTCGKIASDVTSYFCSNSFHFIPKESPIEAKTQESLSPNEINNQKPETVREALQQHTLKRQSDEIGSLTEALSEEKRRTDSYKQALEQSQSKLRKLMEAQIESHKTQESQTDEQYNLPAAAVFQIQMIALADDEMVKRPGAAESYRAIARHLLELFKTTRRNP